MSMEYESKVDLLDKKIDRVWQNTLSISNDLSNYIYYANRNTRIIAVTSIVFNIVLTILFVLLIVIMS